MNRIEELNLELSSLPKGYISKKIINGKERYYLQYREGKKIVSTYIKSTELKEIQDKISKRKEIEEEIALLSQNSDFVLKNKLSKSALLLSGDVMEEDDVVASFKEGKLTYMDTNRVPLFIKTTKDLSLWLEGRSIDAHRTNSRLLKKALRLKTDNDIIPVLKVYGRTLTDHFWFRPLRSKIHFKDLEFRTDIYSDVSLKGITRNIDDKPRFNPELTLIGSYEKCWKIENGEWYMYKSGTKNEIFSEWFCSRLCKALGLPTAEYDIIDGYIKTKNFASDYDFEPLKSIAGEDDSYEHCFPLIESISEEIAIQYLYLIWFDALVYNPDRYNENCGFFRDRKTGKIVSLAPNFDNNLALFARDIPSTPKRNTDGLIKSLKSFFQKNKKAKRLYANLPLPVITLEMVNKILDNQESPVSADFLFSYLNNGQKILKELQM